MTDNRLAGYPSWLMIALTVTAALAVGLSAYDYYQTRRIASQVKHLLSRIDDVEEALFGTMQGMPQLPRPSFYRDARSGGITDDLIELGYRIDNVESELESHAYYEH